MRYIKKFLSQIKIWKTPRTTV